jgi:hypothetical protein
MSPPTSNVWVVFPTANHVAAAETLQKWHELGYRSIVLLDEVPALTFANRTMVCGPYGGFAKAANHLCRRALEETPDIVVVGGDDLDPDPNFTASDIAGLFHRRFPDGFGVMQPMGDAYGALQPGNPHPACVSPWIGRAFIERAYAGLGPYWWEYKHLWADTELWHVAEMLGVLHRDPSITQYHRHHTRGHPDQLDPARRKRIGDAAPADKMLFSHRRAMGFPGHQVISSQ